MARIKRTVTQRDFSGLEIHPDFLEGDDLELRGASLRMAENCTIKNSRAASGRPGSSYVATVSGADAIFDVKASDGSIFLVTMSDSRIWVYKEDGTLNFEDVTVPWTTALDVWWAPDGNVIYMGDQTNGIWTLEYDGTSWDFGTFAFRAGSGGSLRQPYWNFLTGSSITPDGRTGSITVTADASVFTAAHVGERIRYNGEEITITAFTSATEVDGTVVSQLPPSFTITVGSTAEINADDVVIAQTSGWEGVVTEVVNGTQFKAITTKEFGGPVGSESLSFPNDTQTFSSKASINPEPSKIWDEPLMSDARGWAGAGNMVNGRLIMSDFPENSNGLAASSLRLTTDFLTGVEDDDAIVRTVGPSSARFLHIIEAQDVLLISTKGVWVVEIRDGGALTPTGFAPTLIDPEAGAADVQPVVVQNGVIFVEAGGEAISAALLDGNIYLKWTVQMIDMMAPRRIGAITHMGVLRSGASNEPNMLFASDGTEMMVGHWFGNFGQQPLGFSVWSTDGLYRQATGVEGTAWFLTRRDVGMVNRKFIEKMDYDMTMDASVIGDPNTANITDYLDGNTMGVVKDREYLGAGEATGGIVDGFGAVSGDCEIGLPFQCEFALWPSEVIETRRDGVIAVRCFRLNLSIRHDCPFQVRVNSFTRTLGADQFDASNDPANPAFGGDYDSDGYDTTGLNDKVFRVPVTGRRDHNDLAIIKHIPGRLVLMKAVQEVQV